MRIKAKTPNLVIVTLLGLIIVAGCADNAQTDPEPQPDAGSLVDECPRLQMGAFDDCVYTDKLSLGVGEDVDAFCQSPCERIENVNLHQESYSSDLTVLAGVTEITDHARFRNAAGLRTLNGLEEVEKIGAGLELYWLDDLESLEALRSLKSVGLEWRSDLLIGGNPKLETLDGLESLETINKTLVIERNNNLRSIEALESLENVENILIENNPKLPTCQAEALAARVNPPGVVRIAGNGSGSCD
jgi:hypothetical protein